MTKSNEEKRLYSIWQGMKQRCFNPKHPAYHRYGGRGISVSSQWLSFDRFYYDLITDYKKHVKEHGVKYTSLNRINNDGDYELSNCEWSTPKEQAANRKPRKKNDIQRLNRTYSIDDGIADRLAKFAKENKLKKSTVVEMAVSNFFKEGNK